MVSNRKTQPTKKEARPEKSHYVPAFKKQIAIDILDYQERILQAITDKTKHKKRSVLIAMLDYFIISEKEWLNSLGVEIPQELKEMSLAQLTERFGFNMKRGGVKS